MEEWRDIKGFEGLYQVSSLGQVKSLGRYVVRSDGRKQPVKEKILKGDINNCGYNRVRLMKPGITIRRFVHQIVAEAFIPNPANHRTVNHKNGIKTDNRVENLEWATHREQLIHAYETGLAIHAKGEDWHSSKLAEEEVLQIIYLYATGLYTHKELSVKYNVSREQIGGIVRGRSWKHIRPML